MFDCTNTTTELSSSGAETAVISVGATEQSGPCLPLNIDTLCAEYFARHWGQVLNAYVLPTLPFNTSEEHTHFRGTISVAPIVLMQFLEEVVRGLSKQGFCKQVLTCGHGGSYWAAPFIKHINHALPNVILVSAHANSGTTWQAAIDKAGLGGRNEIHGGLTSKCIALFLCPEFVRNGDFGSAIEPQQNAYLDYGVWHKIAPDGCWGQAGGNEDRKGLANKGKLLLETFVTLQGEYLKRHLAEASRLKGIEKQSNQ